MDVVGCFTVALGFTYLIVTQGFQTDETASDFIKNKPVEMTEDDALNMLSEVNIIDPVTNENGAIFTNGNGAIFVL